MLGTVAIDGVYVQVWSGFVYSRCTELMVRLGNVNIESYCRVLEI